MLLNYLKLAVKVLGRNKFYTAISLFGISFTLMILMIVAAVINTEVGPNPPLQDKDRMVLMTLAKMEKIFYDTIPQIDSSRIVDGAVVYDTTGFEYEERGANVSNGHLGYGLIDQYLRGKTGAERETYLATGISIDVFKDGNKFTINSILTDGAYWDVFHFTFLAGQPFSQAQVESSSGVAVINERMAQEYFGTKEAIVGREVALGDRTYRIIGMVADPAGRAEYYSADLYAPYTSFGPELLKPEVLGPFTAVWLAPSSTAVAGLKEQVNFQVNQMPPPEPDQYDEVIGFGLTYNENYAKGLIFDQDAPENSYTKVKFILFGLLAFFVLLPTLNLVNLNISRMLERSPEIGVRKAFGASKTTILGQFLFENIIITFIGGLIGLGLALLGLYLINQSQALEGARLELNGRVFLISFFLTLLFGILSGLLPAWRMSRLSIANAIKDNVK